MEDPSLREAGYRILLVEDEDFLRRIFKLRLTTEGYEVTDVRLRRSRLGSAQS